MNELAPVRAPLTSGNAIRPIVPTDMEGVWRLSTAICKANMQPKGLESPEAIMIAMMYGLELGLTPMAAIQSIAVINGRPTVWGTGLIAIVRGSGQCKYIRETFTGDGDKFMAVCETWRVGEPAPITRTFSIDDAKRARLWGKAGPWTQYPKRMLAARARNFCLNDVYSDFLKGVGVRDEESIAVPDQMPGKDRRIAPPDPDADLPSGTTNIDAEVVRDEQKKSEETPSSEARSNQNSPPDPGEYTEGSFTETPIDPTDALMATLTTELKSAKDADHVATIWDDLDVEAVLTNDPEILAVAQSLKNAALKKLKK